MVGKISAAAAITGLLACRCVASPLGRSVVSDGDVLELRHGGHDEGAGAGSHAEPGPVASGSSSAPARHSGGHVHHSGPPKIKLNETAILLSHEPDPLSYYAYDLHYHVVDPATGELESDQGDELEGARWPGLMRAHVVTMGLAYFVFLPLGALFAKSLNEDGRADEPNAGIMLKIPNHPLHIPANLLFVATLVLSLVLAKAYKASTPDLYEGSKHGIMSWRVVRSRLTMLNIDFSPAGYWFLRASA